MTTITTTTTTTTTTIIIIIIIIIIIVSVPCARPSWAYDQLLSARKYIVLCRIVSAKQSRRQHRNDGRVTTPVVAM